MSDFVIKNGVLKKYTGPGGDVVVPEVVTELAAGCFTGKQSIASIRIPRDVKQIVMNDNSAFSQGRESPFSSCGELQNIFVESGNPAYCDVDGVLFNKERTVLVCCPAGRTGEYTIPAGVTAIGDSAFMGCSGLTRVEIPDCVTSIGAKAFDSCASLMNVTIPQGLAEIKNATFCRCASLTEIVIPPRVRSIE